MREETIDHEDGDRPSAKPDRVDVVEGPVGSASLKPPQEVRSAGSDLPRWPAIDPADAEDPR